MLIAALAWRLGIKTSRSCRKWKQTRSRFVHNECQNESLKEAKRNPCKVQLGAPGLATRSKDATRGWIWSKRTIAALAPCRRFSHYLGTLLLVASLQQGACAESR